MRSVVTRTFGDPAGVIELVDRPVPEPGEGQIRVRMAKSPIHNHDLMLISGTYGQLPPLPFHPGTEAAGVVDAVGPGVENLRVGERVSAGGAGTWSEYYLAAAAAARPLPDDIPDEIGCQLFSMPMSALVLIDFMEVGPGDWIVQNAANGAVGKALAIFGADAGLNVINLVRRPDAAGDLRDMGIPNVVVTDHEGWKDEAQALAGGAPIVRAIDSIGGDATDDIADLLALEARLVSFGALSGSTTRIHSRNLLFKGTRVQGYWGALEGPRQTPAQVADKSERLIGFYRDGRLQLPVAGTHDLAEAGRAAGTSTQPGRNGKILLTA